MKKLILIMVILAFMTAPALATPTLDFTSDTDGGWTFDNTGTDKFIFSQPISIKNVYAAPGDALEGTFVLIPDLTLSGSSGSWTLAGGTIEINTASDGSGTTVLLGTLGSGNLIPNLDTTAGAYTLVMTDITWSSHSHLFSPVAEAMWVHGSTDFDLAFAGAPNPFEDMIDGSLGPGTWSDGLAGSMTIPAPGAILLGSIGVSFVGWLRRRRSL